MTVRDRILNFYTEYQQEHYVPPTIREVCETMGWKSSSTGLKFLRRLEAEGALRYHATGRGWYYLPHSNTHSRNVVR